MNNRIHIVSLDVPFPPDYGAVIDIYYRCKSLKEAGYSVVLHCYEYGRGQLHDFSEVASACYYYDRKLKFLDIFSMQPFIVKSRMNHELIKRLNEDHAPIILEGQHCTGLIPFLKPENRKIAIRVHNIEWQYYNELSKHERRISKKIFFWLEAYKLRRQETCFHKHLLFCVTAADQHYYQSKSCTAILSPSQFNRITATQAIAEPYVLYHGNLSVSENVAALGIIMEQLKQTPFPIPVLVAGKNPSETLVQQLQALSIKVISNPDQETMTKLVLGSSVHLLISNQATGLKLKVLTALYSGRSCIATTEIVAGTELDQFCTIWDQKTPLSTLIQQLETTQETTAKSRIEWLDKHYGPETFIEPIHRWLNDSLA